MQSCSSLRKKARAMESDTLLAPSAMRAHGSELEFMTNERTISQPGSLPASHWSISAPTTHHVDCQLGR
jgi:hypothetical protein